MFVSPPAKLFDLNFAEDTRMKSNIGQSDVREPFSDFADSADDFRQALERPNRASKALSERLAFPKGHQGQNDISRAPNLTVGFTIETGR